MSTQAQTVGGIGGAISIGGDEEDQDPTPDGEVLPEEHEQDDGAERDPDPAGDDDAPRRK